MSGEKKKNRGCRESGKMTGGGTLHARYESSAGNGQQTHSLTMRFDTEKKTPTMGRSSKRAAQNPKAGDRSTITLCHLCSTRSRTSVVPFAFFDEGRNLRFRHPFCLKVLQAFDLVLQRIRYGMTANSVMVMTHRFVKISTSPERLEIRRYEDADEGVDLNGIQED